MARRKKQTLAEELANLTFSFCGLIIKGLCVGAWYALKTICKLLVEVLRLLLNGLRWVVAENKRESALLDERRKEIWEERAERWWGRSAPAEDEPMEEADDLPEAPPAVEEEPLPPLSFQYIGSGDLPVDEPEADGQDEPENDPGEDECFRSLPGGSVEKAIVVEERRLLALYRRKEKVEAVHHANEKEWERYQKTVAWRSLLWDIEDTEKRLEYLERAAG